MLAAAASSSGPGNGNHQWLNKLIGDIQKLTYEIQEVTRRIGLVADPAERDVTQAHDLVGKLLALIDDQIRPRQAQLRMMASAPGPAPNLDNELKSLKKSGREALSAIAVYKSTLGNERRQRLQERRSNPRYSTDQESLHRLQYKASDKIDELLEASERFLHFISS
jgi:hypothetical protein